MTIAFLLVIVLLIAGVLIRLNVAVFRWLYIPSSVIGGFVGLALMQTALATEQESFVRWSGQLSDIIGDWPGWLIAVVFAGMLLAQPKQRTGQRVRSVAVQGVMVWIIVLGETTVGLLAVWLLIQPFFDVPNSFGMLIETGFAGGHGTAAAMGEVFAHETIGLVGGKDLGMLMATFGLVYGIVSGILWINVGIRLNWVEKTDSSNQHPTGHQQSLGQATVESDAVDPLLFQVIWLSLAFGLGMLMQSAVMTGAEALDGWIAVDEPATDAQKQLSRRLTVSNVVDFPLFIYTLFGGLAVRRALKLFERDHWIDSTAITRLTASAMDILVVAAITSLNLSVVMALAVPFLILFVCGAIWTAICLLVVARWILPGKYWFQLGLINYGMSTGTTATGFVLLKMVDPRLESGAAEDYALAAPLSAPFVGGGMITIALPLLLLERVSIGIPASVLTAIVVMLIWIGIRLAKALK